VTLRGGAFSPETEEPRNVIKRIQLQAFKPRRHGDTEKKGLLEALSL